METYDLSGLWSAETGDGKLYHIMLPGTLDENGIGAAEEPAATRLMRKHTFTGQAKITKKLHFQIPEGKRLFVEVERARCLRLFVNGKEAEHFNPPTLVSPHIFEVTGLLSGEDELMFLSDNSYPGLPAKDILYSSTATDETQTNWNGLLGYLRIRVQDPVFLPAVRVYPLCKGQADEAENSLVPDTSADGVPECLSVHIEISAKTAWAGRLLITSDAVSEAASMDVQVPAGRTELVATLPLAKDVRLWDEEEGERYELTVQADGLAPKTVLFGIRSFSGNRAGRLALNGRTIFLRGEANCAEFPESGHEPMTVPEWLTALRMYRRYGVNCVRFHSHCPPEAAFEAADRLGLLLQPELSCWNPENAFLTEESFAYYRTELRELLLFLANHPSFVMLSFGNELQTDEKGHERMREMLKQAHALDATRLIADGSNNHYGGKGCEAESDFYAAQSYCGGELRGIFANMEGYLNREYPNAARSYAATMQKLRENYKKPVFGFEVGQFEVLPDFSELSRFCGVTAPENLRMIQKRVKERGIPQEEWERQVEATGELALLCYREEVEAALRTPEMSGLSLLGLQDFPGQGTALVGMMDSHLTPKPYAFAQPERFGRFFRAQLPLVLLEKYTYENTETLRAKVLVANYGKEELCGALRYALVDWDKAGSDWTDGEVPGAADAWDLAEIREGVQGSLKGGEMLVCPCGALTQAGELAIPLDGFGRAAKLALKVEIGGIANCYPVWVYPAAEVKRPERIYEARFFDEKAKKCWRRAGLFILRQTPQKRACQTPSKRSSQRISGPSARSPGRRAAWDS